MVNLLNKRAKEEIVEAIRWAERETSGEIRVHLKKKCGEDVLVEAKKVFSRLRMHRTRERNAVLIFVAWESRQFAILGDRGIHERVGDLFWAETRDTMEACFARGLLKEGITAGVESVGKKLRAYFPRQAKDINELSNTVTEE